MRKREEVFNVRLAEALRAYGVEAEPENIEATGERPDVTLGLFRGMRIVIEGKLADVAQARNKVQADAQGRLDVGIAQLAIAVVYPKHLRSLPDKDLVTAYAAASLDFAVLSETGVSAWRTGAVSAVIEELKRVHEDVCRQDAVEQAALHLSAYLDGIAKLLEHEAATCDRLSALLGFAVPGVESQKLQLGRRRTAAKVAALTAANAFIFQEQLSLSRADVQPLRTMLASTGFATAVAAHWRWIVKNINYVPIFQVAAEILESIPAVSAAEGALKELARAALHVSSNKAALRHDLMGRIYHYLLHEAKFLGTYYTSVPAATLLLKLAMRPTAWPALDFSDPDQLANFKFADLTCGTGTLLMGACQAVADNFVRQRHAKRKKLGPKQFDALHRALLEDMVHGYDVLPSAVHLTASSLSLLAPAVVFKRMHLFSMPLSGRTAKNVKLGSLDFLHSAKVASQFGLFGDKEETEIAQVGGHGAHREAAHLPMMDLFAMNPPFVRSVGGNLLFGNLPDAQRNHMQTALKRIVAQERLQASITAGLGGVFVALADRYLKPGGRLAFVLPAAFATGEAWGETRALIDRCYHLEYVVTSHDATRWNFSENTSLSELLFVARKLHAGEDASDAETTFVNLWRNPVNVGDALAIARTVENQRAVCLGAPDTPGGVNRLKEADSEYGESLRIKRPLLTKTWWGGAFAQTELLRTSHFLNGGHVWIPGSGSAVVPICKVGDLFDVGPDQRRLHAAFSLSDTPSGYSAIWNHDANQVKRISMQPNKHLVPLSVMPDGNRPDYPQHLWKMAGRLLVAERLRLTSQRISSLYVSEPVLANTWWVLQQRVAAPNALKALTLWFNSSLGLMAILTQRVPTEGPWIKLKKPALTGLPVLDPRALSEEVLAQLAAAFDELCTADFLPIGQMARDPVRSRVDAVLAKALKLPDLTRLRMMLGREPFVCGEALLAPREEGRRPPSPQAELLNS